MPLNDTKTPVDLLREYTSARNVNYRFAYKTVQLPYRPHARFECQVHVGDQTFEAGSDFATKSDAMYAAARVAIRTLMGETKSPEGENSTRSRCDFESAWGNLTVPWWANTKILVDRLQNLGGFTYSYILNEICKTNKITIPLNIQYKEIKENEFIAQLVFLNRLFFTDQSHASERDAKQDLSRIIVWTLLGKIDHRAASRPVPAGQNNMVTQGASHSGVPSTSLVSSAHHHNQRDPISWADVVVRRSSVSSSTAAHPGSTGPHSESYDQSSISMASPKSTTTAATSVTGDMSSIGLTKEFEYPQVPMQSSLPTVYPFPRSVRMPAALEVDNIQIDWPVASVLGCLNLDVPTQAEIDEMSSPAPSVLSELNAGSSLLSPSHISGRSRSHSTQWEKRSQASSYSSSSPLTGWYHRDLSSRSRLITSSYSPSSPSTRITEASSHNMIDTVPASSSSSSRHTPQTKLVSSFNPSLWQGAGSQAVMGLSDQAINVKTATTKLDQFMKRMYPNQTVVRYDQVYTGEGIKASVSCGPLGKFISRKAVGTGTGYNFAEVIEDAASVALETVVSQYF